VTDEPGRRSNLYNMSKPLFFPGPYHSNLAGFAIIAVLLLWKWFAGVGVRWWSDSLVVLRRRGLRVCRDDVLREPLWDRDGQESSRNDAGEGPQDRVSIKWAWNASTGHSLFERKLHDVECRPASNPFPFRGVCSGLAVASSGHIVSWCSRRYNRAGIKRTRR
jgi:hypothetical protein